MQGETMQNNLCFILQRLAANKTICELLYPEKEDLIHKNILAINRIPVERKGSFICIMFNQFIPSDSIAFGEVLLSIEIICDLDNWITETKEIRIFKIMEEVLKEMSTIKLEGIGNLKLEVIKNLDNASPELGGYSLGYSNTEFTD